MAAAKAKSASSGSAPKKADPSPAATPQDASAEPVAYGSGKPDKSLYDAEQTKIKGEIDAIQIKLVRCIYTLG